MAIIAIRVPDKISKKLNKIDVPGERDKADHITMVYFGPIELKVSEIFSISILLSEMLSKLNPFEVSVEKINCFPKGKDGVPIKGDVKSKDIYKLRKNICEVLKEKGMEELYDGTRGNFVPHKEFSAHVNLAYNDEEVDETRIESIKWKVDRLELWCGENEEDGPNIEFRFGQKINDKKMLLILSQIFKKLSTSN